MRQANSSTMGLRTAILLALAMPVSALADDPTINRLLASQCSQCHGTNGYAVGDIDSLAGESVREIREELYEMKFEGTPGDIMDHQALGYTDDQIRRIAEYFATLPERRPANTPAIRLSATGPSQGDGDGDSTSDDDDDDDRDEDGMRDRDHDEDADRDDDDDSDEDDDSDDDDSGEDDDSDDDDSDEDDDHDDERS